jgi:hypothetical protein
MDNKIMEGVNVEYTEVENEKKEEVVADKKPGFLAKTAKFVIKHGKKIVAVAAIGIAGGVCGYVLGKKDGEEVLAIDPPIDDTVIGDAEWSDVNVTEDTTEENYV